MLGFVKFSAGKISNSKKPFDKPIVKPDWKSPDA
jgi:hypothetical protein